MKPWTFNDLTKTQQMMLWPTTRMCGQTTQQKRVDAFVTLKGWPGFGRCTCALRALASIVMWWLDEKVWGWKYAQQEIPWWILRQGPRSPFVAMLLHLYVCQEEYGICRGLEYLRRIGFSETLEALRAGGVEIQVLEWGSGEEQVYLNDIEKKKLDTFPQICGVLGIDSAELVECPPDSRPELLEAIRDLNMPVSRAINNMYEDCYSHSVRWWVSCLDDIAFLPEVDPEQRGATWILDVLASITYSCDSTYWLEHIVSPRIERLALAIEQVLLRPYGPVCEEANAQYSEWSITGRCVLASALTMRPELVHDWGALYRDSIEMRGKRRLEELPFFIMMKGALKLGVPLSLSVKRHYWEGFLNWQQWMYWRFQYDNPTPGRCFDMCCTLKEKQIFTAKLKKRSRAR